MRLFRVIFATYYFMRAIRAYDRRDFGKALTLYDRALAWEPPMPWGEAFFATLLVLSDRSDEARGVFEGLIEELSPIEDPTENERYVLNYCRHFDGLLNGTEAESFRVQALAASPERHVRMCLRLERRQ